MQGSPRGRRTSAKILPCALLHPVRLVRRTFQALIMQTPVLGASARACFVRPLPFSVWTHQVHPGAVCLATIPPAQNHSPLQRRKHPFGCHLPQKPFDPEFSPPRRAQFLPMIPPLPLNLSRTLAYPPLFLPYPADFFLPPSLSPTTLPILPVHQTFSVSAGRSPTPLVFALYPPHPSRPPKVIPSAERFCCPPNVIPSA